MIDGLPRKSKVVVEGVYVDLVQGNIMQRLNASMQPPLRMRADIIGHARINM